MPTTKEGPCPWCGRHGQTLYLASGVWHEGGNVEFWTAWICEKCIEVARNLRPQEEKGAEHA